MQFWLNTPLLTRKRVALAIGVALLADLAQLGLGPLGWTFADEIIDVAAMIVICLAIGFHPLLLPTFAVEFIPVVDMLPTWTACTMGVIALRRRGGREEQPVEPYVSADAPPVSSEVSPDQDQRPMKRISASH